MTGILSGVRRMMKLYRAETLCACLLLVMGLNLTAVISQKSLTNDETYHIPAGYYYLAQGDFRPNEEHPPLAKMLAALPLLLGGVRAPQMREAAPGTDAVGEAVKDFWQHNRGSIDLICLWARVPMIMLTLGFGVLVFVYTRELFGARAAVLAVLLFSLEPTLLAHGRVVHTDVPAAFAYLFFFFMLRRWAIEPDLQRGLGAGAAMGLALVTKFSMIVVLPVFFIMAMALLGLSQRRAQKPARIAASALLAVMVALFVINAAYFFQRRALTSADAAFIAANDPSHAGLLMHGMAALSKILPTSFLYGNYMFAVHARLGHPASLLGAYSYTGWWYYFPVAFALKTTLPFVLLTVAAIAWALWQLSRERQRCLWWLIAPVLIYTIVSMTSRTNIGVRHFLPAFPFLLMLGGAFLDRLLRLRVRRAVLSVALALFICWMGAETARAFPDYIPYMNELAWQHPRWSYLSDSNVEWGDDSGALARYLRARGETTVSGALLGGGFELDRHGVQYLEVLSLDAKSPQTRYLALGASFLNGSTVPYMKRRDGSFISEEQRHEFFAPYRQLQPEAVFGNSIYLYRLRE